MSENHEEKTVTETETVVEKPTLTDPAEEKRVDTSEPAVEKTTETVTETSSSDES